MSGIESCPVCKMRVFPLADGLCPSCRSHNFRTGLSSAVRLEPGARSQEMASLAVQTRILSLGLMALIGVAGALLAAEAVRLLLLARAATFAPGADLPEETVTRLGSLDVVSGTLTFALLLAGLGSFLVFLFWFYEAHANLERGGITDVRYSSQWTWGGFFVPLLSFIRPATVMAEVWRGSTFLAGPAQDTPWKKLRVPRLLPAWWVLCVVSTFATGALEDLFTVPPADGALLRNEALMRAGIWAGSLAAAWATLRLTRQVAALQQAALVRRQAAPS